MKLRRLLLGAVIALIAVGGASALVLRGSDDRREAEACPPGFTTRPQRGVRRGPREARRAGARAGGEGRGRTRARSEPTPGARARARARARSCQPLKHPESFADVSRISANQTARAAAPGHAREGRRLRQRGRRRPAAPRAGRARPRAPTASGHPAGTTPLIDDEPGYDEVNGQGLADLAGRITDYTRDGTDLYASVGEGGVWKSTDGGDSWTDGRRDPADTGRRLGGLSPAAAAALHRPDRRRRLRRRHDLLRPRRLHVLRRRRDVDALRRRARRGARLPPEGRPRRPEQRLRRHRQGPLPLEQRRPDLRAPRPRPPALRRDLRRPRSCFLANMVTDVAVRRCRRPHPAADPDPKVVAAVGWRAGNKQAVGRRSTRGPRQRRVLVAGRHHDFTKVATSTATGFAAGQPDSDGGVQGKIGRIEMGAATGAQQDHGYLYARRAGPVGLQERPGRRDRRARREPGQGRHDDLLPRPLRVAATSARRGRCHECARPSGPDDRLGAERHRVRRRRTYCPGVQAWYNQWVEPDPPRSDVNGVPNRLTFGLEEVWENEHDAAPPNAPHGPASTGRRTSRSSAATSAARPASS